MKRLFFPFAILVVVAIVDVLWNHLRTKRIANLLKSRLGLEPKVIPTAMIGKVIVEIPGFGVSLLVKLEEKERAKRDIWISLAHRFLHSRRNKRLGDMERAELARIEKAIPELQERG